MSSTQELAPSAPTALPMDWAPRRAVNWRSLLLGFVGVIWISALTPFNDMVLRNATLIGGSLPVGIVLFMFLFVLVVNGPLWRFAPRQALGAHELAVSLTLMLVCCAVPGLGLMQLWPAQLVGPWYHARGAEGEEVYRLFREMQFPRWYWPRFTVGADQDRSLDPVVAWYASRIPADTPRGYWVELLDMLSRFVGPTLGWGVFFVGIFGSILGLSFIVGRQWIENERIAFPIGQVQVSLVQTPGPGRYFNETFAARSFWVAIALVLLLRLLTSLYVYFPRYIPLIQLKWDFNDIFADPPLYYLDHTVKSSSIYLLVAALTFFVSSRISGSMWGFMILMQIPILSMRLAGGDFTTFNKKEVSFGAGLAFLGMILWTGRHHYLMVLRQMVTPVRAGEDSGLFLHNRTAGWMALLGFVVAVAWLVFLKMHLGGALLLVSALLATWVVMANVVAHSGLMVATSYAVPHEWLGKAFPVAGPPATPNMRYVATHWFTQMIGGMWQNNRETLAIYATSAQKVGHEVGMRSGKRFILAIVVALVISFLVSQVSHLFCEYTYANAVDKAGGMVNTGVFDQQPNWAPKSTAELLKKGTGPPRADPHSKTLWVSIWCAITAALAFMQLRYSWWPLHPIGLLMVFTYPMRHIWFSIFLGWLVKSLIVKFGGARLYSQSRPFFMGIIIGEVVAAGLFGLLAVVLYLLGIEYHSISFLPTHQY